MNVGNEKKIDNNIVIGKNSRKLNTWPEILMYDSYTTSKKGDMNIVSTHNLNKYLVFIYYMLLINASYGVELDTCNTFPL